MSSAFDVILVGAGAVGSAAAFHAAKSGQRVLLLEQFEIDHQMGSSHGASRIIRYAYDHPTYVTLARAAYPAWRAIEEEAGEELFIQTGGLDFGLPDDPSMRDYVNTLRVSDIPFELLSRDDMRARFPQFDLGDEIQVMYQADAGVLKASKCVRAHVRLAQQHGATVRDNSPVTGITVHANSVTVNTALDTYTAARLILVPGAWGRDIFGMVGLDIPLTPVCAQENYFDAQPADDYAAPRFPVWIAHMRDDYGTMPYGLPSVDGSGLKVGFHGGPVIDLATCDRIPDQRLVDMGRQFIRQYIPGGDGALVYSRACLYTMTPDEHFVIDTHPQHAHIAISASCSGHAFKFSTLIGSILNDLVTLGSTPHDIAMFNVSRFGTVVTASV